MRIYDARGRQVAVLVDDFYQAGVHEVIWDAPLQSSGLYFCRLLTSIGGKTAKLLLVK